MRREFTSFPKSGRSWLRYALSRLGVAELVRFHHDGFEYNDGSLPPLDFSFEQRRARCAAVDAVVYLHREPRDVMISLYFQVTTRFHDFFGYSGSLSEFIRDPYFGAPNLREFQLQWDELCAKGLALRITYEACHRDFDLVLSTVLEHYGLPTDRAAVAAAAESARFTHMQKVEQEGAFRSHGCACATVLRRSDGGPSAAIKTSSAKRMPNI